MPWTSVKIGVFTSWDSGMLELTPKKADLMIAIGSVSKLFPKWLKLVISTRLEDYLELPEIRNFKPYQLVEDEKENLRDISLYFSSAIPETVKDRDKIISRLCDNSSGLFLYASFIVPDIKQMALENRLSLKSMKALPSGEFLYFGGALLLNVDFQASRTSTSATFATFTRRLETTKNNTET